MSNNMMSLAIFLASAIPLVALFCTAHYIIGWMLELHRLRGIRIDQINERICELEKRSHDN